MYILEDFMQVYNAPLTTAGAKQHLMKRGIIFELEGEGKHLGVVFYYIGNGHRLPISLLVGQHLCDKIYINKPEQLNDIMKEYCDADMYETIKGDDNV